MSGAALGMVTALALAATAPQSGQGAAEDFRFGVRRFPAVQQPLFPANAPRPETAVAANPCVMPVLHGDTAIDPEFVKPVPSGPGVPTFTMRWAPSAPCDPSLGRSGNDAPSVRIPQPRR